MDRKMGSPTIGASPHDTIYRCSRILNSQWQALSLNLHRNNGLSIFHGTRLALDQTSRATVIVPLRLPEVNSLKLLMAKVPAINHSNSVGQGRPHWRFCSVQADNTTRCRGQADRINAQEPENHCSAGAAVAGNRNTSSEADSPFIKFSRQLSISYLPSCGRHFDI